MKGIIVISLILLAGLASAYTPEQQTTLDSMNLSFKLGMAYEKAIQGQNVTEYNALVDEYNAWIRQHFGEDASLLKSKLSTNEMPILVQSPGSSIEYLAAPFNSSSDLSKFGKPLRYVETDQSELASESDLITQKEVQFLNS